MTPKPNQESDTPETDAHAMDWHRQGMVSTEGGAWVGVYLARRLERQLAEARQAFAIATDQLVQVQGELRQVREENKAQSETLKVMNDALKEAHRIFGNLSHSQAVQHLCPDFAEVAELVRKSHDQHA